MAILEIRKQYFPPDGLTVMGWCPNKPASEDHSEEARRQDIDDRTKPPPPHRLLLHHRTECADGSVIDRLRCGTCGKAFLEIKEPEKRS